MSVFGHSDETEIAELFLAEIQIVLNIQPKAGIPDHLTVDFD